MAAFRWLPEFIRYVESMSFPSADLVKRFKSTMPLVLSLPDPVTGEMFTIDRDNILALLVIDTSNLILESQVIPMMFGEMARVHAAVKLAKEQADIELRQWKAAKSEEGRKRLTKPATKDDKGKAIKPKAPTIAEVEAYYRQDPEYQEQQIKAAKIGIIADLIDDMKTAFRLKQRALESLHQVYQGHISITVSEERLEEMTAQVPPDVMESHLEGQRQLLAHLAKARKT